MKGAGEIIDNNRGQQSFERRQKRAFLKRQALKLKYAINTFNQMEAPVSLDISHSYNRAVSKRNSQVRLKSETISS